MRGEVWDKVVLVHEAQRLRQPRPDKVRKVHVANAWFPCSPRAARDVSPRAPSDAGAALTWHRQGGLRPKVMSRTSVVLSASDTSTAASTWRGGTRHVQLVRREGRDVSSLYRREGGGRVGVAARDKGAASGAHWRPGAAAVQRGAAARRRGGAREAVAHRVHLVRGEGRDLTG